MSRRARTRANARPWSNPTPTDHPIDFEALAADIAKREQQQAPQQQGKTQ